MKIIFTMVITFCSSLTFALTNSVPELSPVFQSGVLIKTDALQPDGEETLSFCNATFVHPRVLVTAAHCLQGAYILKSFNTEISVGYYKYITRPDGKTVRIGWVDVVKATAAGKFYFVGNLASSFNTSGMNVKIKPEQDIALIVLDQPFSLPATTMITSV